MIVSIISTLCGILLLFNPFKGAVIFTQLVGGFIIAYAVLDIISTMTIRKNFKTIHKAIEAAVVTDAEVVEEKEETAKKAKKKKDKE